MVIFSEGADPDGQGGECTKLPGKPLTKQRSPWQPMVDGEAVLMLRSGGARQVRSFERAVHDGDLLAVRSMDPPSFGWHLSVSHAARRAHGVQRAASRYPTWDELTHARYELLPPEIDVVMHLPPPADYVAAHDTCFHLHEHPPPSAPHAHRPGVPTRAPAEVRTYCLDCGEVIE